MIINDNFWYWQRAAGSGFVKRPLQRLADEALIRNAARLGFRFQCCDEGGLRLGCAGPGGASKRKGLN